MKLIKLGDNVSLLETNHGCEFLYSYQVAVAGFSPLIGHFRTIEYHSKTTNRHIRKYLLGKPALILTPEGIEQLGSNQL